MRIRSINLSGIKQVMHRGELVSTGIFKVPTDGEVTVRRNNIVGDRQADLVHHGGADKAVYGYPWEHYATWAEELDRDDFSPGQFGENLTTEGLLESEVCIGDRLRAGTALLEVSQPRQPCFKLGIKMKLPGFPKQFLKSHRSGFYFRVLEEGAFQAGDPIELTPTEGPRISVADTNRLRFFNRDDYESIERLLENTALAATWRRDFEDILARRV